MFWLGISKSLGLAQGFDKNAGRSPMQAGLGLALWKWDCKVRPQEEIQTRLFRLGEDSGDNAWMNNEVQMPSCTACANERKPRNRGVKSLPQDSSRRFPIMGLDRAFSDVAIFHINIFFANHPWPAHFGSLRQNCAPLEAPMKRGNPKRQVRCCSKSADLEKCKTQALGRVLHEFVVDGFSFQTLQFQCHRCNTPRPEAVCFQARALSTQLGSSRVSIVTPKGRFPLRGRRRHLERRTG